LVVAESGLYDEGVALHAGDGAKSDGASAHKLGKVKAAPWGAGGLLGEQPAKETDGD
jgi:hypothetical protein